MFSHCKAIFDVHVMQMTRNMAMQVNIRMDYAHSFIHAY